MTRKTNKTLLILGVICLTIILGVFFADIKESKANLFYDGMKDMIMDLINSFFRFITFLLELVVKLDEGLIQWSDPQDAPIVQSGWTIARNFVNMFFVLVLLAIALATILDIGNYNARDLLPKLIIAAIFINFSLVIASAIIDSSSVLSSYLLKQGAFTNIEKFMGLPKTLQTNADIKEMFVCAYRPRGAVLIAGPAGLLAPDFSNKFPSAEQCQRFCKFPYILPIMTITKNCESSQEAIDWDKTDFWNVIIASILSIIFILIAILVFALFAIMLFIRILAIWFLLILSPMAWFLWILPSTRSHFSQWWSAFFKWVFFAPIALFFVYLAFTSWTNLAQQTSSEPASFLENIDFRAAGSMGSAYEDSQTTDPATGEKKSDLLLPEIMRGQNLLAFILVCGLLVGSLIVAQKMSITGSDIAMKGAKWARGKALYAPGKMAGRWAGGQAAGRTGRLLQRQSLQGLGLGSLGRQMEARGTMYRKSALETPMNKKYREAVALMSPDQRRTEMARGGTKGLIAAQEMVKANEHKLSSTDTAQALQMISMFRQFGDNETANKLQETRLDATADDAARTRAVQDAMNNNKLNQVPPVALTKEVVNAMVAQKADLPAISKVSRAHADALKKSLGILAIDSKNSANEEIQHAYASQSGDISKMSSEQRIKWAQAAGVDGLKNISADANEDHLREVANYIPPHQVIKIITEMKNADIAKAIVKQIRNTPAAIAHEVVKSDPTLSKMRV